MKEINWIKEEGKIHRRELSGKQINYQMITSLVNKKVIWKHNTTLELYKSAKFSHLQFKDLNQIYNGLQGNTLKSKVMCFSANKFMSDTRRRGVTCNNQFDNCTTINFSIEKVLVTS